MRYVSLFSMMIDKNMPSPSINFREDQLSTFEIIMQQRKFNFQQYLTNQNQINGTNDNNMPVDSKMMLPPELERNYQVFFIHGMNAKKTIQRMRDIRSN